MGEFCESSPEYPADRFGRSGQTYFVIRPMIDQAIRKGATLFIYDFKFDDLTKIAYNKLLQYRDNYKIRPKFYVINFEDANRSHRCNPLEPGGMTDITDATEASRTIMLGLNRDWAKKAGGFLRGECDQFFDGHHLISAEV